MLHRSAKTDLCPHGQPWRGRKGRARAGTVTEALWTRSVDSRTGRTMTR